MSWAINYSSTYPRQSVDNCAAPEEYNQRLFIFAHQGHVLKYFAQKRRRPWSTFVKVADVVVDMEVDIVVAIITKEVTTITKEVATITKEVTKLF